MKYIWAWVPAIILIAFLASRLLMLQYMQDVPVDRTVEDPYIASASYGANQEARRRFHDTGLSIESTGNHLVLHGANEQVGPLQLHFRHPAREANDVYLTWETPDQPLDLTGLPRGFWQLTLTGKLITNDQAIRYEQPFSH